MGSKSKSTQTTTNQYGIEAYNAAKSNLPQSYSMTTGEQINQYMSPYSSNVIDALKSQYADTAAQAQNSVDAAAQSAGAFGGSRHGVQAGVQAAQGQKDLSSMIAQLLNQNYGQALQAAQTENAASNQYGLSRASLLGQLAGNTQSTTSGTQKQGTSLAQMLQAAGTAAQGFAMLSDVRLKTDIVPLGERNGRKWYRFRYLWSDQVHEGVMAQENPDIAFDIGNGFLAVDYGAI